MTGVNSLSEPRRLAAEFLGDRRAVAAVEFAFILPLMLTVYFGGIELGDGFAINVKVTETAHLVGDLASQYVTIDNNDMTNILNASSTIIAPYPSANIAMTVSEISTDANGNATVTWSDSYNGTPRAVGQVVNLPATLKAANISLILGETSYSYAPQLGYVLTGTITITDSYYLHPRLSNSITRVNS
jgi:Flp pilus assembly protein TadG